MTNKTLKISSSDESKNEHVLLPKGCDFLVTRIGNSYSTKINITRQCPKRTGDKNAILVATTTMDAEKLLNLRLEEIDGQYVILNDADSTFVDPIRFSVYSEEIGHRIIKAIIDKVSPRSDRYEQDSLDVPIKYLRVAKLADKLGSLITISCAVLLSLSVSFWLVFK